MASGKPLNDDDRKPWLMALNKHAIEQSKLKGAIIACSALKENYRNTLQKNIEKNVKWVFLVGDKETIAARLALRQNHFMPPKLLQSQFDALEKPSYGFHISILKSLTSIVGKIIKAFNL